MTLAGSDWPGACRRSISPVVHPAWYAQPNEHPCEPARPIRITIPAASAGTGRSHVPSPLASISACCPPTRDLASSAAT